MRNKVNLLFIAALAIPFYSFSSTTTITNEAAPAITVTRILDGDTLEVKDDGELIRIRLVDIDAPEKSQPFGQRAKQKLSELVKDADGVAVSSTGKDRYGRTLAKVYVKKCQPACLAYYVNAEMVKSGLAWAIATMERQPARLWKNWRAGRSKPKLGFGHYQTLLNHGVTGMNINLSNLSYNLNKSPLVMSCVCC